MATGAVELLQRLIRFDTQNPPGGERECVAWIESLVREAGLETRIVAKQEERPNLIARLRGSGAAAPLLLQGHVDVVPVTGQQWTHDPFAAELVDGYVWGRGALDMKGGVAMMLAAVLRAAERGQPPPGDVVLCVLADEEAGSDLGAGFLVTEHRELFDGVRYALSEFGGFTLHIAGRRVYPVQVSEKRVCWLRGVVRGPAGHGSMRMRGGAMAKLGRVLHRLDRRRLPVHVTPVARWHLEKLADELGFPAAQGLRLLLRPALTDHVLDAMGERGRLLDPILHNTVNATIVRGGDKVNVIPAEVELELDGRLLPGYTPDDLLREVAAVVGDELELEVLRHDEGPPAEPDMGMWELLDGTLRELDGGGAPVPYLLPGVTDARYFASLGIQTYGFMPLRLPEGFEFQSLIHAPDERVPAEAVEFGAEAIARVLERF